MGCVSENGCLGPKKREREVHAELIDKIHEESLKMDFGKYQSVYPRNMKIYDAILQKIVKKGYIRKLLDHLTSHRSKIS